MKKYGAKIGTNKGIFFEILHKNSSHSKFNTWWSVAMGRKIKNKVNAKLGINGLFML